MLDKARDGSGHGPTYTEEVRSSVVYRNTRVLKRAAASLRVL